MLPQLSLVLPLFASLAACAPSGSVPGGGPGPDKDGKYEIKSEGLRALFVPYGASISNLFIHDIHGVERDIVLGFDNATFYTLDTSHPHLGGVPGRYANRIKNSSFVIDGETYHILPNENPTKANPKGVDTLHGGPDGWDWRNFTVVAHTEDSITFSLTDSDGNQGFPGEVVSYITYTLKGYSWEFQMVAIPTTKKTPIMLSSHVYWNLDGFQNPNTPLALNHSLWLPYSDKRIGTDTILIPDGTLPQNKRGSVNDFWSAPKQIGADFHDPALNGNCGFNCTGYDTAYLVDRPAAAQQNWQSGTPVAQLRSDWSGIQVDIFSEQEAFQVYSCNGQKGALPLKKTQGFFGDAKRPRVTEKYSCLVLEVEDWIDAINQPQWGRQSRQIFEPGQTYVLEARYDFSVKK